MRETRVLKYLSGCVFEWVCFCGVGVSLGLGNDGGEWCWGVEIYSCVWSSVLQYTKGNDLWGCVWVRERFWWGCVCIGWVFRVEADWLGVEPGGSVYFWKRCLVLSAPVMARERCKRRSQLLSLRYPIPLQKWVSPPRPNPAGCFSSWIFILVSFPQPP